MPYATNATLRVMAANLNGNIQSYQDFALRIFQGLKPDVVAINEWNYGSKTPADFRTMLNTAFGQEYTYFRETGYNIPNGIISRWPIVASGSWDDPQVGDRGFAWARLDIPGPDDLYVVCVHLHSSGGSSSRNTEAGVIKTHIQAEFPAGAYVVVAGDFNLDNRSEPALSTFKTFLKDEPIPTDQSGDPDTNNSRAKPYDLVLTSDTLRTNFVPVKIGSQSFATGLVFDSRVFTPLSAVAPVQSADSGQAQHMPDQLHRHQSGDGESSVAHPGKQPHPALDGPGEPGLDRSGRQLAGGPAGPGQGRVHHGELCVHQLGSAGRNDLLPRPLSVTRFCRRGEEFGGAPLTPVLSARAHETHVAT